MHASHQDTYPMELFEGLGVGVFIADDSALCLDVNRAACESLDRRRSDILGHYLGEFIDGEAIAVRGQWRALIRDGVQTGVRLHLPDGSFRVVQLKARPNPLSGLHCLFLIAEPVAVECKPAQTFLTICAWTKKVLFEEQWLSIEEYLKRAHGKTVTHGICPDALCALERLSFSSVKLEGK